MKTIIVKNFGSIISDKETGYSLLEELKKSLKGSDEIILDLEGVISMATLFKTSFWFIIFRIRG